MVWAPGVDTPLARQSTGGSIASHGTYWYLTDRVGNVLGLINAQDKKTTGDVIIPAGSWEKVLTYNGASAERAWARDYSHPNSRIATVIKDPFESGGRLYDFATGLQNNRSRWFHSYTGQFMSKDSYGYAGGDINLYRYAGNDWANATDPSGHFLLATSLVMLSLTAYETMRFTPTIHSHPGGLLAASDPPAKRWDERDIGKIDDVYGNNPVNYFVGEVTRAQYGDAFLASAGTGAVVGIAAMHAFTIAGAGMSAVSGVSAVARMSLRQILTTQLKKAAVGAAHGYAESALREDSASDTAWNMAFRGFFGFVDPTNSTYFSAGGAAIGAGVGFAIGRDRDSALLGAYAGDALGSLAGRGYHGLKYAPKNCNRWVVAGRMVAVDLAGSAAGAGIAAYYSDGDLDAIMQGAQMGRMVAGAFASIPSVNRALFNACFAAGTPIQTPDGHKNVEDIKLGDLVLSRDENSPDGIIAAQTVEELFVREAILWNLTVGGKLIQTTGEHPFYAEGKGWTNAQELTIGDRLLTEDGTWAEVQSIENTETLSIVYNFRVSDYHTYFVGTAAWGFAVWAHNACKAQLSELRTKYQDRFRKQLTPKTQRIKNGRAAIDAVNPQRYKTPFGQLSKDARGSLESKLANRSITRAEYKQLEWDRRFSNRRNRGVDRFWAQERRRLLRDEPGTRNWTVAQRNDIIARKTPTFGGKPIEGHHMYNATDHPQLADNPAIIYPATYDEHFSRWHGNNWQNDTSGTPLNAAFAEQF